MLAVFKKFALNPPLMARESVQFLFFDVGDTDGRRGSGAADGAGQNKDGQQVGDHIDKLRWHHFGQIGLERFAESEQKPGPGSSKGRPLPKNHGCQADETPAGADAFDKIMGVLQ
jgi:hypothetical protein